MLLASFCSKNAKKAIIIPANVTKGIIILLNLTAISKFNLSIELSYKYIGTKIEVIINNTVTATLPDSI